MANLGAWGAVSGLGQGMVMNAEADRKKELMQMEIDKEKALQGARMTQEATLHGETIASEEKRNAADIASREKIAKEARESEETRNKATLAAADVRSRRSAQARLDAARISASARAQNKKGGWSFQKLTEGGGIDPTTGQLTPQKQYMVLNHPKFGTFQQVGDKFLQQQGDGSVNAAGIRRAPGKAVEDLVAHPEMAHDFLDAYHYLPMQWFSAQQDRDQQTSGMSVSGPAYLMNGASSDKEDEDDTEGE